MPGQPVRLPPAPAYPGFAGVSGGLPPRSVEKFVTAIPAPGGAGLVGGGGMGGLLQIPGDGCEAITRWPGHLGRCFTFRQIGQAS